MNEVNPSKISKDILNLLKSARKENQKGDLLLEIFVEELEAMKLDNQKKLLMKSDALQVYRDIEQNLTQEEKNEFFLFYLYSIQEITDEGRTKLRSIVKKHLAHMSSKFEK